MTLYDALNLIMSLVSTVTILISLILVYRQTRIFSQQTDYVARSMRDSLSQSLNSQSHEIGRIFIEYPEIRPYFYESKPVTTDTPDYQRIIAVAEVILDIFWAMGEQSKGTSLASDNPDGARLWYSYVNDCFNNGPILVEVLKKRENWYGMEMLETARKYGTAK